MVSEPLSQFMISKFYAQAEALVEIVRHGSMTAAADMLRLSKSNVSHKIAEMESDLSPKSPPALCGVLGLNLWP